MKMQKADKQFAAAGKMSNENPVQQVLSIEDYTATPLEIYVSSKL